MTVRAATREPRVSTRSMLEVLADELERMNDPRLELVTFTGVDVSRDLAARQRLLLDARGDDGRQRPSRFADDAADALHAAGPHLRGVLGRQMRIRQVPRLAFKVDPGIVSGQRIEEILREIHHDDGVGRAGWFAGGARRTGDGSGATHGREGRRGSGRRGARGGRRDPSHLGSRGRTRMPRQSRRRRAGLDARACTTSCAPRGSTSVASFSEPFVVAPHYRELPGSRAADAARPLPARAGGDGHVRLGFAGAGSAISRRRRRPPASSS